MTRLLLWLRARRWAVTRSPIPVLVALAGLATYAIPWPVLRRLVTPGDFSTPDLAVWADRWYCASAVMGLAWLVGARDRWMGAALGWLAMTPVVFPVWRAEILVVAMLAAIITLAPVSSVVVARSCLALGSLGLAQALIVFAQWQGYDPLMDSWHRHEGHAVGGTVYHPGTAGSFLAMTGLVAPTWMLVVFAAALAATASRAALVAFLIGLVIRFWPVSPPILAAGLVLALLAAILFSKAADPTLALRYRAVVQGKAIVYMLTTSPVVGLGFARWPESKHAFPIPSDLNGIGATLNPLHNDAAQWIVETGLGGFILLAGWLRARWRDFRASPVAPALAAAAVLLLVDAPLHAVPSGVVVGVLLGLSPPSWTQGA